MHYCLELHWLEQEESDMAARQDAAKAGIGFGVALAITISWSANKSLLRAIVHGVLSWFYVIYYAVRYHFA